MWPLLVLDQLCWKGTKAADAVASVLEQRRKSNEWRLTAEEEKTFTSRVCGVVENLPELRFMLAMAVES